MPQLNAAQLAQANARLHPLILQLASATVPLCQPNHKRLPVPAGSGVLFRVGQRRFLLSASHVFDPALPEVPIHAVTPGGFVALSRVRWRTRPITSDGIADRTDLSIVPLGDTLADQWASCRFLELDDIDPYGESEELEPATGFLAIGYPNTKQPRIAQGGFYSPFAHHFLTHREPIEQDNILGANPELHIAVGFDPRDFVGQVTVPQLPHPLGMSGGGLWRIANAVTTERPHAKLVGVLIEYHERVRIILATRVACGP